MIYFSSDFPWTNHREHHDGIPWFHWTFRSRNAGDLPPDTSEVGFERGLTLTWLDVDNQTLGIYELTLRRGKMNIICYSWRIQKINTFLMFRAWQGKTDWCWKPPASDLGNRTGQPNSPIDHHCSQLNCNIVGYHVVRHCVVHHHSPCLDKSMSVLTSEITTLNPTCSPCLKN